ncbi:MAG: amidinotransferase, partial [Lutibacter sp.]|nr:amidinotransferase [Lutibacter sp.]
EYTPIPFVANQTVDGKRLPIYHTNVMMCLAETFAVICLDSIDAKDDKKNVLKHLKEDKKEVILISEEQVVHFAGNMLQVLGENDERFLVMSQSAKDCLTKQQVNSIEKHCKIISSSLTTIETCGGGSARCMMAEVFLPKNG